MTCIVGLIDKKNKTVYIGGDSCSSGNNIQFSSKIDKVFRNGDFLFGCCGSYRMIQLLRYSFKPAPMPEYITDDCDDKLMKYLICSFIPEIKKIFNYEGFGKIQDNENLGGTFLLAYKDRLFKVQDDYSIEEFYDSFTATGCGEEYALGAMFGIMINIDEFNPYQILNGGFQAAAKYSPYCDNTIKILNT